MCYAQCDDSYDQQTQLDQVAKTNIHGITPFPLDSRRFP